MLYVPKKILKISILAKKETFFGMIRSKRRNVCHFFLLLCRKKLKKILNRAASGRFSSAAGVEARLSAVQHPDFAFFLKRVSPFVTTRSILVSL